MIGAIVKQAANPRQVANLVKVPARNIYPHMSSNHIAGLPRNKSSTAEKFAGGLFIATCVLATPAWIVTHLNDYRGGPAEPR